MIEIYIPDDAIYDELVLRTITNITIKQLCFISEKLEGIKQAYDLLERKKKNKVTGIDLYYINNLESKYTKDIYTLASIYERYYEYVALEEVHHMGRRFFKEHHTDLLDKLNEMIDID
jgi:NAD(P)H-nitrite reductase large subunit|nr:MAG TPA: hypothetical protein [Caudoviricetes sp.]